MSMTDPVSDLLARIRNASLARQDTIEIPASRLKANIVKVLRDEGYIDSFKLVRDGQKALLKLQLKYDDKGNSIIQGLRRISRPGLRRYVGCEQVAKVRSGSGTAILSTSKGVLTGKTAKSMKVGGEFLCEVW